MLVAAFFPVPSDDMMDKKKEEARNDDVLAKVLKAIYVYFMY